MDISYTYKGEKITRSGPDNWSGMNTEQFVACVRILDSLESHPEKVWALPVVLLGMRLKEFFSMTIAQRHSLLASLQHLSEFKNLPTKWMIPSIEVRFMKWYGPNEKLSDLVFAEFMFAETMLDRYYSKKDEYELDRFIAILYRPRAFLSGGQRSKFDQKTVDGRAKLLKNVDRSLKRAILLNYQGWKIHLRTLFKHAFKEAEAGAKVQKSNWLEQAIRLAEHRQSEVDVIKTTNLYEVLSSFNLRIKDHEAYVETLKNPPK